MNGTYEEKIFWDNFSSFTFKVTKESWLISFYFPGPDFRHKGTFLEISKNEVDSYISAFNKCWSEYLELKAKIPAGGSFRKDVPIEGKFPYSMTINVGNNGIYQDGICIYSYHMPINSVGKLNAIISAFKKCKDNAPKIMQWLFNN